MLGRPRAVAPPGQQDHAAAIDPVRRLIEVECTRGLRAAKRRAPTFLALLTRWVM